MNLSKNFTLEELTKTDTGGYNIPGEKEVDKLLYLATYLLQPIRDKWGKVRVNSAYRSAWVNEKIGGSRTSQHMKGEAADIFPEEADMKEVFLWCKDNLQFGQLINEEVGGRRWIHISLPRCTSANSSVLKYDGKEYTPWV